jgi:hypothetical protein
MSPAVFYWTGVLWWACLGLSLMAFGLRQIWLGVQSWRAINRAHVTYRELCEAERAIIPAAPFQVAPPERLVTGESFEQFCARECGMTERRP